MANGEVINKGPLTDYIKSRAKIVRSGWTCSQVSNRSLDEINARVKNFMDSMKGTHSKVQDNLLNKVEAGKYFENKILPKVQNFLENLVDSLLEAHPSVGRTFNPFPKEDKE